MKIFKKNPALTLFFIAPVFGELFSSSSPLNEFINPLSILALSMLYGCGAIIARELTVRWNKGWLSLLLLGFAYGIFEEGIMVRSFFDPNWTDLDNLGLYGRVAGVNWVWAYHLSIFHALISIAASIVFVETLYPNRRAQSWVTSRKWWRINWILFLLTLPLGKSFNPYNAPNHWLFLSWISIFLLAGLARFAPEVNLPPLKKPPPHPRCFFLLSFFGTLGHYTLIHMGADEGVYPFTATILLITIFDIFILWLALRWSGNFTNWDDRHRQSFIAGILVFFLAISPLTIGTEYPILYFSNPVYIFILWLVYRKTKIRVENEMILR
jgi:hypothetical protein